MSSKKFIVAILSLLLDNIRAISSRKIALTIQTVPFNGMFIIYATYKTYKRWMPIQMVSKSNYSMLKDTKSHSKISK